MINKGRKIWWAIHTEFGYENERNTEFLAWKPSGKLPLRRSRRRWELNNKYT
jgi:hypothetical protein